MRTFRDRGGEAMRAFRHPSIADDPRWSEVTAMHRNAWVKEFDLLILALAAFGIRIEDDQTPHGPDVGGGDARTEHT